MMMKHPLVLATALAVVPAFVPTTPTAAQRQEGTANWCDRSNSGDDRATYNEVREYTVPASGATIAVDASPNGGIKVEGQARQDVHVQACVSATAESDAQARALAQRVEVVATAVQVSARGPEGLGRRESWSVSYRLEVPNRTSLSLKTVNGGIGLTAVDGDIEFRTTNGGVSLNRLAGNVHGRTTNGGVSVELDGTTWNGQGLDVETTNGGVKMAIPSNYNARLETSTVNGGLNIDFPIMVQGKIGRSVEADLGAGGPLLKVRTSNGGVNIRRK